MLSIAGFVCAADAAPPRTEFTSPDSRDPESGALRVDVREGYVAITWSTEPGDWIFELESALSNDFGNAIARYEGRDSTSFVSGLEDGDHYFRVRAGRVAAEQESVEWGPWSEPLVVAVEHHALTTAWQLFGAGAVLFLCTVFAVVASARRSDDIETPDA